MQKWFTNYFFHLRTTGYMREMVMLVLIASLIGVYIPDAFWLFDVAGQFTFHYVLVAVVALGWFVYKRRLLWAFLAVCVGVFNIMHMVETFSYAAYPNDTPVAKKCVISSPFNVVVSNLYYHNTDPDTVVQTLRAQNPDIIGVVEMTPDMRDAMREKLSPEYRYVHYPDSWAAGAGLWSRYPVLAMKVEWVGEWKTPYIWADVVMPNETVLRVYLLHAWSPGPYGRTATRDAYLRAIGDEIGRLKAGKQAVVIGDFNITRYMPAYQDMLQQSGLDDPSPFVPIGTWPSVFMHIGVPIDHILTKCLPRPKLSAFAMPGSDHRALAAAFKKEKE